MLYIFNLVGVCALAVICVLQWKSIASIDANRDRLELTRQEQAKQITDQAKTIADQSADLEDAHKRLALAEDQLENLARKLATVDAERDQLRTGLEKWKLAIDSRDATIKQASTMIESLATQRDAVIAKFNDTANKYNELVKKMSG